MVYIRKRTVLALLSFAMGISAAPANGSNTSSGGDITIQDIIDAPYNPPPVANPAFVPIVAASNDTLVEGNPAVKAKVDNLPSVLSSITAAAVTATDSISTSVPTLTAKSKARRGPIGSPPTPAPVANYLNTECASFVPVYAPGIGGAPGTVAATQLLWNTLARKVCHDWFGNLACTFPYTAPGCSPAVYVLEDSYQVHGSIPTNPVQGFQFEYTVRDNSSPFWEYYATSQDLCTVELEARIQWMFSNCLPDFGDVSGFSSYDDGNSVIVYKAWKLPNDPTFFSPQPTL